MPHEPRCDTDHEGRGKNPRPSCRFPLALDSIAPMTPTNITSPVRIDTTVWSTTNVNQIARVAYDQAIILEDGEFLVRFLNTGAQFIARFNDRTRVFFGIDCPTFDRFTIDTVVRDGALWGVRGERIAGTWAVRPEALG